MAENKILTSWKEIGNYIGRGVRTVQRWEELYGMPVHRPAAKKRAAVIAFSDEIDQWLNKTSLLEKEPVPPANRARAAQQAARSYAEFMQLIEKNHELLARFQGLLQRSAELQGDIIERATAAKARMSAHSS